MHTLIFKYEGHINHLNFETEEDAEEYMIQEDIGEAYIVPRYNLVSQVGYLIYNNCKKCFVKKWV